MRGCATYTDLLGDIVVEKIIPRITDYLLENSHKAYPPIAKKEAYIYKGKSNRVDFAIGWINDDLNIITVCIEVKTSLSDLNSGHGRNFVGNFNVLVVPDNIKQQALSFINDNYPYVAVYSVCIGNVNKSEVYENLIEEIYPDIFFIEDVNNKELFEYLVCNRICGLPINKCVKHYFEEAKIES